MALKKFIDPPLGEKIKEIRLRLGLSQKDFGEKLFNYSQGAVDQWENGRVPHAMIIREIARLGKVSTDELQ